jgi:hypothetical protein
MYGYRVGEVPLKTLPEPAPGAEISLIHDSDDRRGVVAVSLGPHLDLASLPHPDNKNPLSLAAGCLARFMSDQVKITCPQLSKRQLSSNVRALNRFVRAWLRKNLEPLSEFTDVSFKTWISEAPYPQDRKVQLSDVFNSMSDPFSEYDARCKLFMKDEFYPDFKYPRPINHRSDSFKTLLGPYSHAIEKELFQMDWFIKKIPIDQRPHYIVDRVYQEGASYVVTDYTSFEANFTPELMQAVEFELYRYMLSKVHDGKKILKVMRSVLLRKNISKNKFFSASVNGKRMSGEMTTSLGNSFSNLMFMLYVCHQKGSRATGVVEGDDGLFRVDGPLPSANDFASLGLNIKLDAVDDINVASFCGQVFDKDALDLVTDPREVLAQFGWTTSFYVRAKSSKLRTLLRAKAYSYLYQYPACPIICRMASAFLRLTRSYTVASLIDHGRFRNTYERSEFLASIKIDPKAIREIHTGSRVLVETLYGLSQEIQLKYENYFDNLEMLEPIPLWFDAPRSWIKNSDTYVVCTNVFDPLLEYPPETYPRVYQKLPITLDSVRLGSIDAINADLE